jgi:hypothetical protein
VDLRLLYFTSVEINFSEMYQCLAVDRGCCAVSTMDPHIRIISFLDWSRYFFHVTPQLYWRGWADPIPDPLLRISGSTGNEPQNFWICSQELWPLDHRGSQKVTYKIVNCIWTFSSCKGVLDVCLLIQECFILAWQICLVSSQTGCRDSGRAITTWSRREDRWNETTNWGLYNSWMQVLTETWYEINLIRISK